MKAIYIHVYVFEIWDLSGGGSKINAQYLHASDDGQGRLQDVAVDDGLELHLLLPCITTLMENPGDRQIFRFRVGRFKHSYCMKIKQSQKVKAHYPL